MSEVFKTIIDKSFVMSTSLDNTKTKISSLDKTLNFVSASTQEIAAGLTETSSLMLVAKDQAENIKDNTTDIVKKTKKALASTSEIKSRAEKLKSDSILSSKESKSVILENQLNMKKAIKEAENINEIKLLSNTILSITEHTKLLSLNARVEAAHAGELGNQYSEDASYINDLVNSIVNSSDQVLLLIGQLNAIIETINIHSCNGSLSTTEIASKIIKLTKKSSEILSLSNNTKDCTNNLLNIVKKIQLS